MTATQQIVADHHMRVDAVSSKPKKVLIVVANQGGPGLDRGIRDLREWTPTG